MFKGMNNIAPSYLCNRVNPASNRHERKTRFAVQNNIVVPLAKNNFAKRTFVNSTTNIWNNLPTAMKQMKSLLDIKSALKRHTFS